MSKKILLVSNIATAVIYAIVQVLIVIIVPFDNYNEYPTFCSVLFTGVLAAVAALLVLPEKYKKTRILCTVLAAITFLLAIVFSILIFVRPGMDWREILSIVFAVMLVAYNIAFNLINSDKTPFLTQVTLSIGIIILILLSFEIFELPCNLIYIASAAMVSCSIAMNLMVPSLKGKKLCQKIVSIGSLAFLILPALYLIRGWWGFNRAAINTLTIISILIVLACTVYSSIVGWKELKSNAPKVVAPKVSALKAAAPVASGTHTEAKSISSESDLWVCPQCGKSDNENEFCVDCGTQKPAPVSESDTNVWICPNCGHKDNVGNFCGKCGNKKPEPNNVWVCPNCGHKDNTGKFCGKCGNKKDN